MQHANNNKGKGIRFLQETKSESRYDHKTSKFTLKNKHSKTKSLEGMHTKDHF